MKKCRMKISIASAQWSYFPGMEVLLNDELAKAWEEIDYCEVLGEAEEAPIVPENGSNKGEESETGNVPPVEEDDTKSTELNHVGQGYYLLPNGEKVRGKEKAIAALKQLEGEKNGISN